MSKPSEFHNARINDGLFAPWLVPSGTLVVVVLLSVLCRRTDRATRLARALRHGTGLHQRPGVGALATPLGDEWLVHAAGIADLLRRRTDTPAFPCAAGLSGRAASVGGRRRGRPGCRPGP